MKLLQISGQALRAALHRFRSRCAQKRIKPSGSFLKKEPPCSEIQNGCINCETGLAFLLLSSGLALAGCGMPGAPLPPSLNLPVPVADLTAERTGDQVALTWTMPKKTTDKVVIDVPITVRVCRNEDDSAALAMRSLHCNSLPAPAAHSPTRFPLCWHRARRARSRILSSSSIARAGRRGSPTAPRLSRGRRQPPSLASARRCAKTACCCTGRPRLKMRRPRPFA